MGTKRNDHAPENECVDCFNICPKRAILGNFFVVDLLLFFFFKIPPCNCINIWQKIKKIKIVFLCHSPLSFAAIEPLLPLPPQNPLEHVSGLCRHENRPYDDLNF
jgi:hypothetical protein